MPATTERDAFGRIYEYFLAESASSSKCSNFHGRILDPAYGAGGMFVESARFVSEYQKNPASELSVLTRRRSPTP